MKIAEYFENADTGIVYGAVNTNAVGFVRRDDVGSGRGE
jgi:hypothetical protein